VSEATKFASGTRSDSLIVVMSAFQLPSIDVASAALGVAFKSSLIALPCSADLELALTPGARLCAWSASARFTKPHDVRASVSAPPVPHELSATLATTRAMSGTKRRASRATSQQTATGSH
jgi:hypothetical protein